MRKWRRPDGPNEQEIESTVLVTPPDGYEPDARRVGASGRRNTNYDLGDVSVTELVEPHAAQRRRRTIPWLAVGLAGAAVVVVFFAYAPTRLELARVREAFNEAKERNDLLTRQVVGLEEALGRLEGERADLVFEAQRRQSDLVELERAQEELAGKLEKEITRGGIMVSRSRGQVVVDVSDRLLFDSGQVRLNTQGRAVLKKVADTLLSYPDKVIEVRGHTDNLAIAGKLRGQFPTNWELSVLRATTVVRFLQEKCSIPGERLVPVGFSQYSPTASNATRAGRRKNRRIELVLTPQHARR